MVNGCTFYPPTVLAELAPIRTALCVCFQTTIEQNKTGERSRNAVNDKTNFFVLLLLTNTAFGQNAANPITGAEIDEQVTQQLDAFANLDYQLIAAKKYAQGPGFGFRTRTASSDSANLTIAMRENAMKAFFDTLEYYNISVEEIQTAVYGDTGIAWGVHI